MTSTSVPEFQHRTVLLDEAVDALALDGARADGVYVDGTFGRGGHSRLILSKLGANARLIAFDKDLQAIATAEQIDDPRFTIVHDSFATMTAALAERGVGQVDGILLDLGISSPQVDDAARGFSFRNDGPLDMRMDTTRGMSAAAWLATETEQTLEKVIKEYGEERFAFQIAKAIVARRAVEPISTTRQLAGIVAGAVKTREKGKDPATRTFQAIRIFINKELEDLEVGLNQAYASLAPGGIIAIISFHSLEDRMVKRFFASKANVEQPDRRLPIRAVDLPQPELKLLSKMKPSDAEVDANPRSRSAVMRVARRLPIPVGGGMSGKINLVLTALLVGCGLSLVNAQYQARHLFIELERSQSKARQLDIEWAQLQLDQSTLGKHARIEEIARRDLAMTPLTAARTQYLTPEGSK